MPVVSVENVGLISVAISVIIHPPWACRTTRHSQHHNNPVSGAEAGPGPGHD